MDGPTSGARRVAAVLAVGLLIVMAGCSGFTGSGGETETPTETEMEGAGTPTDAAAATETETPTDSATTTSDGHSHTQTDAGTESPGSSGNDSGAATGEMAVVVGGERLDLSEAVEGSQSFRMDGADTWRANGSPTLASVLSMAGVDASSSSLSYDGQTFQQQSGTVVYRVNGEPVDPTQYTLSDGDEVWVLGLSNESTPDSEVRGEYISPDNLHVHGSVEFTVDGQQLDFSRDKWQAASHNSLFHFEGGHAEPWHAHAWGVPLAYGFSTLEDINVTESGVTYNGTTYTYADSGPDATVTVNGEEVDPTQYLLKDGDSVEIVLESDS